MEPVRAADPFDVVVIGGGAAGLSAATVLGRSRRSVLVIDSGAPRNAPADGVHSFLSRDGIKPAALLELGRDEVARYGGQVLAGEAVDARPIGAGAETGFEVDLADGGQVVARRLLVATGLVDELPDLPGLRERWGRDVIHCPYCHGWEVRDEAIGIIGSGPMSVHQTMLFRQLSDDVVFFAHTAPSLTQDEAEQLSARGVRVVEGLVDRVEVDADRVTGVRLADGSVIARQALVVAPRFVARAALLAGLGLRPSPHPMGLGELIATVDPTGRTEVAGVWVAGNVTDLGAQVISAAAQGVFAAAAINADLVGADARGAVESARSTRSAGPSIQGDES